MSFRVPLRTWLPAAVALSLCLSAQAAAPKPRTGKPASAKSAGQKTGPKKSGSTLASNKHGKIQPASKAATKPASKATAEPVADGPATARTAATPAPTRQEPARPLIGPVRADVLSPVGHWVEKGNNNNELQLWWDFNPDGTLTVTAGATAKTRWKLEGDTLTVGVATPQQPAGVFAVRFANGHLYSTPRVQNPPTLEYTRIGTQRYDSAPLVGRWQITNAPHAADPHEEEVRNRMVKAVTEYNPDGTYEVRAPIDATQGTWDAAAHTYTLKGYTAMPFERKGTTLVLTSPVGPKGQRTYVPDGFF